MMRFLVALFVLCAIVAIANPVSAQNESVFPFVDQSGQTVTREMFQAVRQTDANLIKALDRLTKDATGAGVNLVPETTDYRNQESVKNAWQRYQNRRTMFATYAREVPVAVLVQAIRANDVTVIERAFAPPANPETQASTTNANASMAPVYVCIAAVLGGLVVFFLMNKRYASMAYQNTKLKADLASEEQISTARQAALDGLRAEVSRLPKVAEWVSGREVRQADPSLMLTMIESGVRQRDAEIQRLKEELDKAIRFPRATVVEYCGVPQLEAEQMDLHQLYAAIGGKFQELKATKEVAVQELAAVAQTGGNGNKKRGGKTPPDTSAAEINLGDTPIL